MSLLFIRLTRSVDGSIGAGRTILGTWALVDTEEHGRGVRIGAPRTESVAHFLYVQVRASLTCTADSVESIEEVKRGSIEMRSGGWNLTNG